MDSTSVFTILLLSVVLFFLGKWILRRVEIAKCMKVFPGPKPLPLIGNALEFKNTQEILYPLLNFAKKFGGVVKFTMGFEKCLLLTDPNYVEALLTSTKVITKSNEYTFLHRWLGEGLLTNTGEKWQKRRKLLTPAFHFQILEQFLHVFNSASDVLVEKLRGEVGKSSTDIYPYITLCTLDIICESAMGIKINAQENGESEYAKWVKEMGRICVDRMLNPLKHRDFPYMFSKDFWKERKALKYLHSTTDGVIRKRREMLLSKPLVDEQNNVIEYECGVKRRLAFLDLLLRGTIDGKPLLDADIREEVDTFMFEGHDTTSSGITFALYNLATHPEVQEKVYDEIKEIFQDDKTRAATYQDLQEMKYLEMVIKESLRLYPPVPLYNRTNEENFYVNGTCIPTETLMGVFAFGIHRNPDFFKDPEKFDPERFNQENKANIKPFTYVPFSAGPRNCIGQKFAMLELKSTISKILRHYELLPVPDFQPTLVIHLILKSINGVLIKFKER